MDLGSKQSSNQVVDNIENFVDGKTSNLVS